MIPADFGGIGFIESLVRHEVPAIGANSAPASLTSTLFRR